ncbi:hypothetical protein ACO1O0_000548 [Amphichorda felina]
MPPRQTATGAVAAVWITDAMLCRAIEQYQRRSLVTNRTLSSHGGLYECRRRPLGKRNMAAIMASPPAYHPTWWFELRGNKHAWQWEPPTSSQCRRDKEGTTTLSGLADKFIRWLEASDLDKPFLQPPAEVAAAQSLAPQRAEAPARAPARPSFREAGLMAPIAKLRRNIGGMEIADKQLQQEYRVRCTRALVACLRSGNFTNEQVRAVLESLTLPAAGWGLPKDQLATLLRPISRQIISTIAFYRRKTQVKAYDDAWTVIVDKIFSMKPGVIKFRLFRYMMHKASAADIADMKDSQFVQVMQQFVRSHGDTAIDDRVLPIWFKRASLFSQAINRLPEARFEAMVPGIEGEVWDRGETRRRWLTWFLVRACLKHSKTDTMSEMMVRFRQQHTCMTNFEVRTLSMARLVSEGFMDNPAVTKGKLVMNPSSKSTALADMTLQMGGMDSLKGLMAWLRSTQDEQWLFRSLLLTRLDPETEQLGLMARRVMEKMMDDPAMSRRLFLLTVDLVTKTMMNKLPDARSVDAAKSREQLQCGVRELVEWVAYWYMQTPHLNDRQALRGVEWCIKISEKPNLQDRGSSKILVMLAKMMIQDLEQGKIGRTTRLRWLVAKIEQYHGAKAAKAALKTLEGWRQLNIERGK